MNNIRRTKDQLIKELRALRRKSGSLEKKLQEKSVHKRTLSEDLYHWETAFDSMSDAVCILDKHGTIQRCNKAMVRMFKKASFRALLGKKCWAVVHGSTRRIKGCPVYRMLKTRQRETMEMQFNDTWLHVTADPFFDQQGNLTGAVHILSDITAQKRLETELEHRESLFRAVFDNAIDGILLADVENKTFHSGNNTICRMLGYSEKEITKLGVKDIHPEADLPFVAQVFEKQARKETKTAKDIPIKQKDASVFYADINAFPVTLAGQTYLVGIFRDVTERKHAEEVLRESEKRYRTIVENINDALYMHDFKGNIIDVNENACKMLGYKREDLIGANLSMLDSEKNKRLLPERLSQLIKKIAILFEGQHVRKDGRILPVEISAKVVTREGSGIIQGFVRDISDRKKTDEEIRQRIQELENFYDMAIGRELRMIELKEEIEKLKEDLAKCREESKG